MYSPERMRSRKRSIKPYYLSPFRHFPSVRSLLFGFSFFTFLYLFTHRFFRISSSSFHPILVVSSLSKLSSSNVLMENYSKFNQFSPFIIDDRVLFPDHVLLLVSSSNGNAIGLGIGELEVECVYSHNNSDSGDNVIVKRKVLSLDEYNEIRFIVRCPLPPVNFSAYVTLQQPGKSVINLFEKDGLWRSNQTVSSWENVAYEAALDGNTVVVFVKGLSHRPDRESDPTQFSCHFGLGNSERGGKFVLTTRAVTVAQEVVRCLLPRSIANKPHKAQGIRISVSVATPRLHSKVRDNVLVPSVAKIFGSKLEGKEMVLKRKHKLCVCTMVWNQAYSLREWITYHAWLGVEKWFIYDNNSDDGIREVIEELELGNYNVTRHVWPWIKTQEAGFSHCALRAREECDWVSFMDVDEFFYFPYPNFQDKRMRNLGYPGQNSLRYLVSNFSSSSSSTIGEIRTSCHSFGPSGLSSLPPQGATVGYTCRLQSPERHKSIIRPDALDPNLLNVVHHFHLRKGFRFIDLPQRTAVINHYKYQVWEAFRAKFKRRVATYVADWQDNQNEGSRDRAPGLGTEAIEPPNWRLQFCEVWDTGLRDFVLAHLTDPITGFLPWERSSV